MEKKTITEEMHLEKEWFAKAKEIKSIDEFAAFAKELFEGYEHDYGTCVHAISALALAAASYGAHKEDITGFQAGFVMWDFIRHWNHEDNKCGFRLVNYDDMLYPQYSDRFEKRLSPDIWKKIQEVAQERLDGHRDLPAHPSVQKHWESIVAGNVPFGFVIKEEL